MSKDSSKDEKTKHFASNFVKLPDFVEKPGKDNEVFSVAGTNVIRVPFGIRVPRRKKPEKNQNIATLVLPITSVNSPTPPFVA
tara:strand:+ start:255 stop:503 length:249 start_codon:yes stop_codon:yes gene_type:complete